MPTIFSLALGTQRTAGLDAQLQSARKKRKRLQATQDGMQEQGHDASQNQVKSNIELEYTAVVSPLERLQRRVAGQPLDQPPPPLPFPHAGRASTISWTVDELPGTDDSATSGSASVDNVSRSLHLQHLAALTAIVHRSLLTEEFTRASRALGLMFREDSVRRNAATRNHGYTGIAAEVLLRQGCSREAAGDIPQATLPFTREGFENAKRFYERLIIKHPYHKSWPTSVNAVDFYLAMFNLWIYVTHAENNAAPSDLRQEDENLDASARSPRIDRTYSHARAKVRELEQANEIAIRMDTCMATLPYMDEPELIRLRAMVALWTADLHDYISDDQRDPEQQVFSDLAGEPDDATSRREHAREADLARDLARELLARLEGDPRSDE
ncbi:hypothetical protein A1O1_03623 [Capronia coronata CBS 617.96]|uniref:Transcription factor domain-containing protein n=1 Tax=Capronia coronata CBS 617.96 TaxID=1182541 RepID=W9YLH0_9EURO|nr:uncharacterized protein A1O1_03623 [Capronia coronata CBS 617.96]EXJ90520.1 hypothetical protein A1O1_03623 [Capronia coronata CBS 617.96]